MTRIFVGICLLMALVACGQAQPSDVRSCKECGDVPSTPYSVAQSAVGTPVLTTPVPTATPEAPAIVEMVEERVDGIQANLFWIPILILVVLSPWWVGGLATLAGMTGETAISHSHNDEHGYFEHTQIGSLWGIFQGGVMLAKDPNGSKKDLPTAFRRWRNLIALVLVVLAIGGVVSQLWF